MNIPLGNGLYLAQDQYQYIIRKAPTRDSDGKTRNHDLGFYPRLEQAFIALVDKGLLEAPAGAPTETLTAIVLDAEKRVNSAGHALALIQAMELTA